MRFCGLDLPNNVFLAPMAGVTTRPFRTIALGLGSGMAWTEMISAEGLVRGDRKTREFLPREVEGGAVAVQIFGHRPEVLRDAALLVESGPAAVIDINMGCPVRKIVKGGSGAALLRKPEEIGKILRIVCSAVRKPVTVKIRSGWDEKSLNAVEVAKIAAGSGAAAVAIHARTARQGFSGRADWDLVAEVTRRTDLPVIGSGDLKGPVDVEAALKSSGCAAVMIGRAAMGRPWIFQEVEAGRQGRTADAVSPREIGRLMLRHLEMNVREYGAYRGTLQMRSPLAWYSRGLPGAADFRRRINTVVTPDEMRREVREIAGADESG